MALQVQVLYIDFVQGIGDYDALLSHGAKPTWRFHKVKLRKLWLSGTFPASNSKKG